jgi:hypothetical protein
MTLFNGRTANYATTFSVSLEWLYCDDVCAELTWLVLNRGKLCKLQIDENVDSFCTAHVSTTDAAFLEEVRAKFGGAA